MNDTRMMRAVAIDRFGGAECLRIHSLPVPEVGPDEVLIRIEAAGIGPWDAFEREGGYAEMLGIQPAFPHVLGSEGAGTVVSVGDRVERFRPGARVYVLGFLNPKGGLYAEYAAVNADHVSFIPGRLPTEQAAAVGGVGITALRGVEDTLQLKQGESLLVFGASGGVGHVAVQIARRRGARVLAAASGPDGVALAQRLGADMAVDGRRVSVSEAARAFAPHGLDAALLTAGGEMVEEATSAVRDGGRIAFPKGIEPEPKSARRISIDGYYGEVDPAIIARLDRLVSAGSFEVYVGRTFALAQAGEAHRVLQTHHLGKLVLRVTGKGN